MYCVICNQRVSDQELSQAHGVFNEFEDMEVIDQIVATIQERANFTGKAYMDEARELEVICRVDAVKIRDEFRV